MQLVSNNYKESMKGLVRNQSFIKIGFSIVDQDASKNVTLQANSNETYSDLENTNDGYDVTQTYITMEKGRYKIGTGQVIYDNTNHLTQGYVSGVVADENGEFEENPIITIVANQPLSTLGFTFNFDMVCKEAPKEIRIKAYLGSVLVLDDLFPISLSYDFLELPIEAWDSVQIEFTKVLPYHRARLDSIVFGITKIFNNDNVLNATMIRQCSPISTEIAQNSFNFEIENYNQEYNPDNPSNIYKYVEEEQEVVVTFGYELDNGNVEWINGGKYVLDGMPTVKPNSVQFKAVDTLGDLTDIFYKGMYRETPISMYDLAIEVLVDAGLKTTEYVLDEHMKTVYTKAPLPIVTHKECLQIIANACQCLLYVNRDGKITFEVAIDPTTNTNVNDFYLDFNTSKSVPIVKKQQPLYAVDVKCYSWNVGENKELFKETISVNGSITLKVEYNPSVNIVVSASSGFSVESQIFTQYGVIILTGTGDCELIITGDELVESNMVVSNVVGLKGETKTLNNPLITDTANAQLTAEWIADWLTKRNEYDIEYRGNAELDAYDMIYAQSQFEDYFTVRVVKNEVTFNGALSGKLNARRT